STYVAASNDAPGGAARLTGLARYCHRSWRRSRGSPFAAKHAAKRSRSPSTGSSGRCSNDTPPPATEFLSSEMLGVQRFPASDHRIERPALEHARARARAELLAIGGRHRLDLLECGPERARVERRDHEPI